MTIQRQYSLPNCTLFLEGLSDATTGNGQSEMRPVMSILVNAECHLAGGKPTISGGREFFESLVKAVSRYAQAFISGVPHPDEEGQGVAAVKMQQIDRHLHRLIVQDRGDVAVSNGATGHSKPTNPIEIDLTTVQLFDLVEAVDQFFADTQTLPDLSVPLVPVSRRYARTDEPIAKRAAPAALGVSSLALAAIALFLVPVPEVQKPQNLRSESEANSLTNTPNPTEPVTTSEPPLSPTPTTEALLSPTPTPTSLATPLASPTPTATPGAFSPSPTVSPTAGAISPTPGVTSGTNLVSPTPGETTGANPVSPTPNASPTDGTLSPTPEATTGTSLASPTPTETPGTALVSPTPTQIPGTALVSPTPTQIPGTALVSPTPTQIPGTALVSPTTTNSPSLSRRAEITDSSTLRQLNRSLYSTIQQNLETGSKFPDKLEYRVGVRADGTVVEYEPRNQAAIDHANQTPLPKLQSSSTPVAPTTGSSEPVAYYRVVFTRRGVLEVSPWRGIR